MAEYISRDNILDFTHKIKPCGQDYAYCGITEEIVLDKQSEIADELEALPFIEIDEDVTVRTYQCIKELYKLVDKITENARKHDLSLLRVPRGASGCDMHQGLPPICRIRDDILSRYEDIISEGVRYDERDV